MNDGDIQHPQISPKAALDNIAAILTDLGALAAEIDDAFGDIDLSSLPHRSKDRVTFQRVDFLRQSLEATAHLVANVATAVEAAPEMQRDRLVRNVVLGVIRAAALGDPAPPDPGSAEASGFRSDEGRYSGGLPDLEQGLEDEFRL